MDVSRRAINPVHQRQRPIRRIERQEGHTFAGHEGERRNDGKRRVETGSSEGRRNPDTTHRRPRARTSSDGGRKGRRTPHRGAERPDHRRLGRRQLGRRRRRNKTALLEWTTNDVLDGGAASGPAPRRGGENAHDQRTAPSRPRTDDGNQRRLHRRSRLRPTTEYDVRDHDVFNVKELSREKFPANAAT